MLFAIGDYDDWGEFGIVEADSQEEAIHKLAERIRKDQEEWPTIGKCSCEVLREECTEEQWKDDEFVVKKGLFLCRLESLPIAVVEDGVFVGENC